HHLPCAQRPDRRLPRQAVPDDVPAADGVRALPLHGPHPPQPRRAPQRDRRRRARVEEEGRQRLVHLDARGPARRQPPDAWAVLLLHLRLVPGRCPIHSKESGPMKRLLAYGAALALALTVGPLVPAPPAPTAAAR